MSSESYDARWRRLETEEKKISVVRPARSCLFLASDTRPPAALARRRGKTEIKQHSKLVYEHRPRPPSRSQRLIVWPPRGSRFVRPPGGHKTRRRAKQSIRAGATVKASTFAAAAGRSQPWSDLCGRRAHKPICCTRSLSGRPQMPFHKLRARSIRLGHTPRSAHEI